MARLCDTDCLYGNFGEGEQLGRVDRKELGRSRGSVSDRVGNRRHALIVIPTFAEVRFVRSVSDYDDDVIVPRKDNGFLMPLENTGHRIRHA